MRTDFDESDTTDLLLKRQAITIVSMLPEDHDEARAVLKHARFLVDSFLSGEKKRRPKRAPSKGGLRLVAD
jgi:hypothetical protein